MDDRRDAGRGLRHGFALLFAVLSYFPGLIGPLHAAPPVVLLTPAAPGVPTDTGGSASSVVPGSISADGRYMVFTSSAPNLFPGLGTLQPAGSNVFLYDRMTGTLTLVSHAAGSTSTAANGPSYNAVISADGRYVAYLSGAPDLIAGATIMSGGALYLFDRTTEVSVLVSHGSDSPTASPNSNSYSVAISDDGAYLAYVSIASNLVAGQTDVRQSIFLYDRASGNNTLVSHAYGQPATPPNGFSIAPLISSDGRYIAYVCDGSNLVAGQSLPPSGSPELNVFLYDRVAGANVLVSHASGSLTTVSEGESLWLGMSKDGSAVAFIKEGADTIFDLSVSLYDSASGALTLLAEDLTTQENSPVSSPVLSADGRYVAFASSASSLIPGQSDTNGAKDIFLYDRSTGTTTLISHQSGSPLTTGDKASTVASISDDGRYVAYQSQATHLIPGQLDGNSTDDLFLFDRTTGVSTLISHNFQNPAATGAGASVSPVINADGTVVLFSSDAYDLVSGSDLNHASDVYLYDLSSQGNTLLSPHSPSLPSLSSSGSSDPLDLSADGRFAVVLSDSLDLAAGEGNHNAPIPNVFLIDTQNGGATLVSHDVTVAGRLGNGAATFAAISRNGNRVAYTSAATNLISGPAPLNPQVYLYDRASGSNVLVSHQAGAPSTGSNGAAGRVATNLDGRYIVYESTATNLVAGQANPSGKTNLFLYDRTTGSNVLISHQAGAPATAGSDTSIIPAISTDGRYVIYESSSHDLVAGATVPATGNVTYLYDRLTETNVLVGHANGAPLSGVNTFSAAVLSADGRYVLFDSFATNISAGQLDGNGFPDVFLWDRVTDSATLVSHKAGAVTTVGNSESFPVALSADARFVLWESIASDVIPGGIVRPLGEVNLFLYDRLAGTSILLSHPDGAPNTGASVFYSTDAPISADGSFVVFASYAPNLVPGQIDSGTTIDLFLYDRIRATTQLLSRTPASPEQAGNGQSPFSLLSAEGSKIVFGSSSSDLVAGDYNASDDSFLSVNPLPGRFFFTLSPCRLFDSRTQGPALASGVAATLAAHDNCGIPDTARAVVANITVTRGSGAGHLTLYPEDVAAPLASTLNFSAGQTRTNNAILPLSLDGLGHLSLLPAVTGGGTVHVILDVSGYFE